MDQIAALRVLGLPATATPGEVREAYRDLAKVWHPDRFGEDERLRSKAEQKLKEINEAYQQLKSDPAKSVPGQTPSQHTEPARPARPRTQTPPRCKTPSPPRPRPRPDGSGQGNADAALRFLRSNRGVLACLGALGLLWLIGTGIRWTPAPRPEPVSSAPSSISGETPSVAASGQPVVPTSLSPDFGMLALSRRNAAGASRPTGQQGTFADSETGGPTDTRSRVKVSAAPVVASPVSSESDPDEQQWISSACLKQVMAQGGVSYDACITRLTAEWAAEPTRPDLSGLSLDERQSIQSACLDVRTKYGPTSYYRCVRRLIGELAAGPKRPDLAALNTVERQSIEAACSPQRTSYGPAAYSACLIRQLKEWASGPRFPDLRGLSSVERQTVESACLEQKTVYGPAAYNRCLISQIQFLKGRR